MIDEDPMSEKAAETRGTMANTNSGLFNLNNLENEDVVNLLSNIAIQVYQKEERDG